MLLLFGVGTNYGLYFQMIKHTTKNSTYMFYVIVGYVPLMQG